jgi:hypothetical protein
MIVAAACLACACGDGATPPSSTSSSTTSTTTPSTVTETWDSVVPVGGSTFYSFSVGATGTVGVTLAAVSGQFVPSTVMLGVGVGTPSGMECTGVTVSNVSAGATAQVTATRDPGLYCVAVSDIGNLFSAASVSVTVTHP